MSALGPRADEVRDGAARAPLRIGIACFPTAGGSGVVGSELAIGLAARGHAVHVFSYGVPGRLGRPHPGVTLHKVDPFVLPPLEHGAYSLALAAALADTAERERLDLFHVHYALPHAASALLAQQILRGRGVRAPALVTTLHGTDVGAVGADPALRAVTRHVVLQSDRATVPSAWLRKRACEALELPAASAPEVVANFVDPAEFRPGEGRPDLPMLFPQQPWDGPGAPRVLVHASNFRPLKRVGDAVIALAELQRGGTPCVLVLVGDGPERPAVARLARSLGVDDRVCLIGEQVSPARLLAQADLFLLPSETESFGLAALEALSCGVPVVGSDVGGVPEVVRHGETGLLVPAGDPQALAAAARALLQDEPRRAAFGRAARADVLARFRPEPAIARFEAIFAGLRA